MKSTKFIITFIFLIASLVLKYNSAEAQSVYFQRYTATGNGVLSAIPVNGPQSAIVDIVGGLALPNSGGIEFDGTTGFYYSDVSGNQILKATRSGQSQVVVSSSAGLNSPKAISLDPVTNYLYILDYNNSRIVRVNLSSSLPISTVEIVADSSSGATSLMTDMKFNTADGKLYWSNVGDLRRSSVRSETFPITFAETINTQGSYLILYFDFDAASPQNIYFSDGTSDENALYKSEVNSPLSETSIFDSSGLTNFFITGLTVQKDGNSMCYTALNDTAFVLRCGNRQSTPISGFIDAATSALVGVGPSSLLIDNLTVAPPIVKPDTQPAPATIQVNDGAANKSTAIINLQPFSGADTKKSTQSALLAELNTIKASAKNAKAKIGFQYEVEIKRATDSTGTPVSKKQNDLRKVLTKRNELTVKKLKDDSIYSVKYRVQITSKTGSEPPKVVKRTPFSTESRFTVPQ